MIDTETTTTLTVHPAAAKTLTAMNQQASAIAQAWGTTEPTYGTKAFETLSRCLGNVMGQQGEVWRDGDLSLYLVTFIHIGVIFHSTHYRVMQPQEGDIDNSHGAAYSGRYCMESVDGAYCGKQYTWTSETQYTGGQPTCEGHDRFPVTMPVPGEWSMHS